MLSKGFTLIELVIVIVILAILSSIALPSFIEMLERNTIKQAAESLKSDLQYARTEAIKQSQNMTVSRNTGNEGAWCYGISTAACDCSTAGSCSIRTMSGSNFGKVNLTHVSDPTTFTFRRGAANSSNTCLTFSSYEVKVYTNDVGRTLICSDGDAGTGYPSCSSVGVSSCP